VTSRALWIAVLLVCTACGGSCPEAAPPKLACNAKQVPVGRWTGDWESYPLSDPNFVRSGTIDVVITDAGQMTGQTVEEDELDRGTISGKVRSGGAFEAEYAVTRERESKRYALSGSFVCEASGIGGMGVVSWADAERGNMKFSLHRAP
jgi:hypothetical protein